MLVKYGNNDNHLLAREEVYGIGETAEEGPSRPIAYRRKLPRVLENAFVERVQLQYELRPKSPALAFVPKSRLPNVRLRNETDEQRCCHEREVRVRPASSRSNSSRSSRHGRPACGSLRYSASRSLSN